jgi:hypothetical protein
MKPVRGLRGSVGPASLDTPRDPQDITSTDGISPSTGVAASQVQRVRRRDELFDDVDEPSDEFAEEPIMFGRTAALSAAQKVSLGDRSLKAFRSADIGALINRLVEASATRAAQTVPAVDVLRRLKRLMDLTERRRNAARPVAGQGSSPTGSPHGLIAASDGVKRLPPPPRPDFAPSRERKRSLVQGDDRDGVRSTSAGLKTNPNAQPGPGPATPAPPNKDGSE